MDGSSDILILVPGKDAVIGFAGRELAKYASRMSGRKARVETGTSHDAGRKGVLAVGLRSEFPGNAGRTENDGIDDEVYIDVAAGRGIIAGANPRSVLLAVYRFLTEAGCRWVRPGADGEYVPKADFSAITVRVDEKASYRHRGVCIEGAVGYEHVAEIIDWLPKVGFNSYFIQFREAYTFFERWYAHRHNPLKTGREFTVEEARRLVDRAEEEIAKRGLLYHAVGHGWTCEPFGIPGLSWDQRVTEVPPDTEKYLALVNGKRGIWQDIPLNTNLCYSNPEVRRIMNEDIVAYIKKHPGIEYLHFWLADERNNQCECDECVKAIPSEFYVTMLNELDERLTSEGISSRIVFLIYYDLLWPPVRERLKNPDRFVLMFAPITRMYDESFAGAGGIGTLQPYVRNNLRYPTSVEENLAYLKAWQKIFNGDGFDFDYHMMWAHYFDTGYYAISKIVGEDVKSLRGIGLNGLVSCQVQRAFMPTGLPMTVMARTLWNDRLTFDEIADDYFSSAFGPDGAECAKLLSRMPELLGEMNIWNPTITPEMARKFDDSRKTIAELEKLAERNLSADDPCRAASWKYLSMYLRIAKGLADVFTARAVSDRDRTKKAWEEVKEFIRSREDDMKTVFDVFEFIQTMEFMNGKLLDVYTER